MRYVVTGAMILNDMEYADGHKVKGFLGGTIYSFNGIKPYTDDVLFVTVVGPDYDKEIGDYFRTNGISFDGIIVGVPKTQYSTVKYKPSGEWKEYSIYGEDYWAEWSELSKLTKDRVLPHISSDTKGIYMEASAKGAEYWNYIDDIRKKAPGVNIMWEVYTSDTNDHSMEDAVIKRARSVDMYSLNLPESMNLFGTKSEEESIQRIKEIGVPCFFRCGTKGAYMIQDGKAWFSPSVGTENSVDATGCGNCSTACSLYGYTEGFHPLKTVIYANIAASLNAAQYGPYPHYTKELREKIVKEANEMFDSQIKDPICL
ncbi:MAG: carbohydrate kinase family protein [Oscillospiraceae bacterium]|jgi:sugar/nucleoside kinase (ribokinase family)